MKNVRIAILGLGGMGQIHLRNCLLMKNVETTVASASELALLKAKKLGVKKVYSNYKDLLSNENLDAVIIALPNFLHKESARMAAEKGLDIFIEKPMARTAEECKDILECAEKNDVKVMIGFSHRFVERNRRLKSVIDNGALGDIELIACEYVSSGPFSHKYPPGPVPQWWFDPKKTGGGVLIDIGSHMIDLMRWLTSSDASVRYAFLDYKLRLPMEDTAILVLQHKNAETKSVLMLGWFGLRYKHVINVYGMANSISSEALEPVRKISVRQGIGKLAWRFVGREPKEPPSPYGYEEELKHFIDCIREDKKPSVSGYDGLECAKLIDKAYDIDNKP
jgi:myo-inositol 2-dehydrogenase/D-chiro-inositol 1-dehydrogenase